MVRERVLVSEAALQKQREYIELVRKLNERQNLETAMPRYALIETFGCQQNSADSDRIRGMLCEMGYVMTQERQKADLILFNTCAVREHAELKVFGNIGALCRVKEKKPSLIVGVCGCMMQQEHRAKEVMDKHRHVDLVFGTHALYTLPEMLYSVLANGSRVCNVQEEEGTIAEGIPVSRDSNFKAWVTIMYGCNNFCTYCIVPYLRGRERSRDVSVILEEISELAKNGYKEIMLLGQNVNSYGKDLPEKVSFAQLLSMINEIPGDFSVQFMTSHPKDCSKELLDVMARCKKVARRLHLPVQSGSDRILKKMNRTYTREHYLELLDYARKVMPDLSVSSDIIVGFPSETEADFQETLDLVKRAEYDGLYTFIYSKRRHTPAAEMPEQISKEVKGERLTRLTALQQEISKGKNSQYIGQSVKVLVEGVSKNNAEMLTGRTDGGKAVHFSGDLSLEGKVCIVKITKANSFSMYGELL